MQRIVKKAAFTALTVTMLSSASLVSTLADSDSSALGGFSYLYENYLTTKEEGESEEETTATLLSDKVTIPENVAIANVEDSCNIREGAGTNYNIIGIFPRNAYCIVLDEKDGWAHIKSGGVTGYIKTDYLFLGGNSESDSLFDRSKHYSHSNGYPRYYRYNS